MNFPEQLQTATPQRSSYRTDIQALRGLAVILVVVYHSGLGIVASGYLGVDMFFVISGFLITGIVTRAIREDRFSFADFYSRRVRRLLPAAYTMLVVVSIASAGLLTASQYRQFFLNLVGSLFFSANFTLWSQTGYFAPESAYEPLLHMWSLAIEEQYYLLLPIILVVVPRRFWLALLVSASALCLAGSWILAMTKPGIAFYWLPPRAWELGIGSVAALIWQRDRVRRVANVLLIPGMAALTITPFVHLPGPTPGLGGVLVCLGAAVVILAKNERADGWAMTRAFAWVGDFSYSLYLVHWPLFALVRATRMSSDLTPSLSVLLIVMSFALALVLYRLVEAPLRAAPVRGRRLAAAALGGALAVLGLAWALGQAKPDSVLHAKLDRPVYGITDDDCMSEEVAHFDGRCTQSPAPELLLWGDSFSAHLVPGLSDTARHPFAQASKGHCSPFANYAAVATTNEHRWSLGCLAFNASVMDYVRRTPSLKVIILAGRDSRTLPNAAEYAIRTAPDGSVVRAQLGVKPTIEAKRDTVAALRALGKRVVVISGPPPSDFDLGICWQRMAEGVPIFGPYRGCAFRIDNPARSEHAYDELITGFEQRGEVPVIRLDEALCRNGRCQVEAERKPLFRDTGHFSEWGSQVVGRRLNIGETAWVVAR